MNQIIKFLKNAMLPYLNRYPRITSKIEGRNDGIIFTPDWSNQNSYLPDLYKAISSRYNIRVAGIDRALNRKFLVEQRNQYQVIHIHWLHHFYHPYMPGQFRLFIQNLKYAKSLGYHLIWTVHNYKERNAVFRYLDFVRKKHLSNYIDDILVHSESAKDFLSTYVGISSNKIHVIPHGCYETNDDTVADSKSEEQQRHSYLFFGRIKRYKGIFNLLCSYRRLEYRNPDSRLVIAGMVESRILDMVLRFAVRRSNTIFYHPGRVSEDSLKKLMEETEFVVLPYRNVLTSGVAILAFSHFRPIIGPRKGDFKDFEKMGLGVFYKHGNLYHAMLESREVTIKHQCFEAYLKHNRWDDIVKRDPFPSIFSSRA